MDILREIQEKINIGEDSPPANVEAAVEAQEVNAKTETLQVQDY